MNLIELNKIVNGKISGNCEFNKIKINSNEIKKGDLFLAINDGYKYINDAINNGASCVISKIECNIPYIKVNDSIETLGLIANYIRNKYNIPVIAITGSVGKTSTKELIYSILSKKYKVLKNYKNNNNKIGLPLTLLNLDSSYDFIVLELGMNHLNEISNLSKICNPTYSIITNIGSSHIGNLGSKKNILKAKLEILDGMNNNNLIVNGNDSYLNKLGYINVTSKSLNIKNLKCKDFITFNIDNVKFKINLPKHLLDDILLSIKIGLLFNVDLKLISEALNNFNNIDGRYSVIKKEYTIINDCYNSSLESLIGGLESLKNYKNHKYIIIGDMLELGKYSKYYHLKINKYLNKIKNKTVLLIGEYTKYIEGIHFNNLNELKDYLLYNINLNDLIYLKGSNKMNLEKILEYL